MTISDLARIRNVTFETSSFAVEISKILGLKDLQLNISQGRSESGGFCRIVWRNHYLLDEVEAQQARETVSVIVQPPDLFPFDYITLELVHRGSFLVIDDDLKTVPLHNVVEPFFKVLSAFCPIDEFRKMLLKPETFENAPEKMFENAVSWLLSLAGFHTIYLGANSKATKKSFDVLRVHDKYHIGSTDIVAYEDNKRVLLVECDIKGVDEKKIQKLIEICDYFKSGSGCKELEIVPVLFVPRDSGEAAKNTQVAIADRPIIESMLEELAKGDRESARSKIATYSSFPV